MARVRPQPDDGNEWKRIEPSRGRTSKRVRDQILRAHATAKRLGAPYAAPRAARPLKRGVPDRIRFLYRRTKERLLIERESEGWAFTWRNEKRGLGQWTKIETSDRIAWIVDPPGYSTIQFPRRERPGLSRLLSRYSDALSDYAAPELEHQRTEAAAVAQIMNALLVAVRRSSPEGIAFIDKMEAQAKRFVIKVGDSEGKEPGQLPSVLAVQPRTRALELLATRWADSLQGASDDQRTAEEIARKFIEDLRCGTFYAKVASQLPKLWSAGPIEEAEIGAHYRTAMKAVMAKRAEKFCERCAPGKGGPGNNKNVWYHEPIPGDTKGWGCLGRTVLAKTCGPVAEAALRAFEFEQSERLVCCAAEVLGYPATKARHLFSFRDKRS